MIKSKNSFTWTKILILALIILACFFLRRALMPLWISIALAYVLNPLVSLRNMYYPYYLYSCTYTSLLNDKTKSALYGVRMKS